MSPEPDAAGQPTIDDINTAFGATKTPPPDGWAAAFASLDDTTEGPTAEPDPAPVPTREPTAQTPTANKSGAISRVVDILRRPFQRSQSQTHTDHSPTPTVEPATTENNNGDILPAQQAYVSSLRPVTPVEQEALVAATLQARAEPTTTQLTATETITPAAPAEQAAVPTGTTEQEVTPAERVERERLIDRIADRLVNTRIFGKPLPELVYGRLGTGGIRWGAKEIAKGFVSWSGAAGAIGGGIAGTAVTGAFVGAVAGAAVEYTRQINANLNQRIEANPNPNLTNRKAAFLRKFGELRHGEVYTNVNRGKLAKAAVFGAITGAGAGLIAEIPGVREFLDEQISRFTPRIGYLAGTVGNAIGQAPGMEGLGTIAREAKSTVEDFAGGTGQTIGDKLGEAGRWANINGAGDVAQQAQEATKEAARQADLKGLQEQINSQNATISDLQKQAGAIKDMVPKTELDAANTQIASLQDQLATAQKATSEAQSVFVESGASGTTDVWGPKTEYEAFQDSAADASSVANTATAITPIEDTTVAVAAATATNVTVDQAAAITAAAVKTAAEQATAQAAEIAQGQLNEAFENLGYTDTFTFEPGNTVAEIAQNLGKELHLEPNEVFAIAHQIAADNNYADPEWLKTAGSIDVHNIPVGTVAKLKGTKDLILDILKNRK